MTSPPRPKSEKVFSVASAPHLSRGFRFSTLIWSDILWLLPLVLGSLVFFGLDALRILSVCIVCGLVLEWLFEKIIVRPSHVRDGSSVLFMILFALFMPPHVPFGVLMFGAFVVVVLAKEAFGGTGQYIFHPAAVGCIASLFFAPHLFESPAIPGHLSLLWWNPDAYIMVGRSPLLIFICGALSLLRNSNSKLIPMFYFSSVLLVLSINGHDVYFFANAGIFLLTGFFLLTESTTSPMTKNGKLCYALFAGLLASALSFWMKTEPAVFISALLSNAVVPLIDRFVVPERI